ncbi:hypothetical protein A5707_02465 [Mycobacterium kyorinense]|uniref:DUF732 domain-containing protein n=1 Tax=Mycobacterium kyorinense TaxID=487514 RepID=A0A1A2Z5F8_9MYCO|nr:hypothetical protein [Mycobacterium kyorinense]OBI44898.1 hypothetical protein A5707_02465 [Mycobacterium kyorinense]
MFLRISALIAVTTALAAPNASADPSDPVGDSEQATCSVLSEDLNGEPAHDEGVITSIAQAIAEYYGIATKTAVGIELEQVKTYCPALYPDIEQVAQYIQEQEEQSDAVA